MEKLCKDDYFDTMGIEIMVLTFSPKTTDFYYSRDAEDGILVTLVALD